MAVEVRVVLPVLIKNEERGITVRLKQVVIDTASLRTSRCYQSIQDLFYASFLSRFRVHVSDDGQHFWLSFSLTKFRIALTVFESIRHSILWNHRAPNMPLRIKNPEAEKLAREISNETGESLTDAIIIALRDRRERLRRRRCATGLAQEVEDILHRLDALPTLDDRSEGEIIGY